MHRQSVATGIILIVVGLLAAAVLLLGLLVYQTTPNSVLANQTFIGRIPGLLSMVRVADRSMNFLYRGSRSPDTLPHYELYIDKDDLQAIEEALPTELPSEWYGNLFLTEDSKDWSDGTFVADGTSYDVKVRVRGDLFNHWAYNKKSWRIKFKDDQVFDGMSEMNIIIPEDRGWFAEPLDAYRAQKFSLLTPPMRFVTVSLNGSAPMLYTQVEHWTKEMLEKQARPGDANLYQTGGGTSEFQQWDAVFEDISYWDKYTDNPSRPDNFEEIQKILELSKPDAHLQPNYMQKLENIFDVDRLIVWYAHSLLAGSSHIRDHNLRLYFDPSRGRFEPVPWDTSLYPPRSLFALPGNPFLNEAFRVPELRLATYRFLWSYIHDDAQVQDDRDEMLKLRATLESAAYRDGAKLPSNRQVKRELDNFQQMFESNLISLKDQLSTSEVLTTQYIPTNFDQERGVLLRMDIDVRGPTPAVFSGATLPPEFTEAIRNGTLQLWKDTGNQQWDEDDIQIPTVLREELTDKGNVVIQTTSEELSLMAPGDPVIGANEEVISAPHTHYWFYLVRTDSRVPFIAEDMLPLSLKVRNAVTGKSADEAGNALVDERTFERLSEAYMSKDEFLQKHRIFRESGENDVVLRGTQTIIGTVIVPSTIDYLVITPNSVIRMSEGASILSYAPVYIVGEEGRPVTIQPREEGKPWGVFAVLNARDTSTVQWADISGGGEATINGTYFTGQMAFHGSPVHIWDSTFSNAYGDDGLNLKYVYADVQRSKFIENSFDGLDVDVAPAGVVETSDFMRNGNDGLDISWSPIVIRNITADGNTDKCISVGERSVPQIEDAVLQGCDIGVAVKDGSQAIIERVVFTNNKKAISAYVKKPFFAAPSVSVSDSIFNDNVVNTESFSGAVISVDPPKTNE